MWEGRKVITYSSPQFTILALPEPDGRWVAILMAGDKPFVAYDPPYGYDWPLEVGKTWNSSHRLVSGTGQTIPVDVTWKVEAYEEVKVPAGTFNAFRVSATSSDGVEVDWFAPDLGVFVKSSVNRNAKYWAGGAGTQEGELISLDIKK